MKSLASLRENQMLVLCLAASFHAITLPLAQAWLSELTPNALRKVSRRLVKARLLHRYAYGDRGEGENYYVLSRRAVRLLDLPPRRVGPLGWSALIQAVGVMGGCVAANLEKLTAAEFARDYPEFCAKRGMQRSYYALTPEDGLAWIVVDHGASGFSLARKIQKLVAQRYRLPAFRQLIVGGGLSVIIATATPEKSADIEAALEKDPPRFLRVQVVVVPQLVPLLIQKGKP